MKISSLFLAVLVSAGMAFSQTSIQGTVTDSETGEPIIFGTVAIYQNEKLITGTETDLDGFYSIIEIDAGEYQVEFSYTGYATQKITGMIISAGKANILNATMSVEATDLKEVVVVYERPLIEQDNLSCGAVFSKEQIKNLPTRDVNGIVGLGCEVTTTKKKNDKGEDINIRGSRVNATNYYLDGVRVPDAAFIFGESGISLKKVETISSISAGTLTAGEINDFNSWELWQDISEIDLEQWKKLWQIHPTERYTVQAMTEEGQPIADAEVKLFSESKTLMWAARTDNTGRAELWLNSFSENMEFEKLYAEVIHKEEKRKVDNLIDFKNGINTVTFQTPCEQPNKIDILFVVDGTGSMGDEINFLKAELTDVIKNAKTELPDISLNLGSLFYRDIRDEYLTRQSPLSENISQTVEFIKKQNAGGGGDKPEAVEIALDEAINQIHWSESARARLLFLVLDAPPHHTPEIIEELKTLSRAAAEKGIRIIPVAGSGIDKSTEYLSRSLALLTNGTYTFLTDHSGVGDSHIEPTSDVYEVEHLNELLVRLILQYADMPDCGEQLIDREAEILNDKKLEKKLGMKIFPNPSSGPVTIQIKMDIDELYVTDLSGKILIRHTGLKKGKTPINLSNLPNGSYLIRATIKEQSVTEKVVVLH